LREGRGREEGKGKGREWREGRVEEGRGGSICVSILFLSANVPDGSTVCR